MSYDVYNRLIQVAKSGYNTLSFDYDHQGRRISKNPGLGLPVRNYLYDGDNIYGDYGSWTNPPSYLYVHGPNTDEPLIRLLDGFATPYFYHQDGLGSVVALTVPTGIYQVQLFDAWGNRVTSGGDIPQYGYTGREPDENGLLYYRARHYDPTIGRFLQRDPIGFEGGLNMYAYVSNNPTNLTDPSGLAPPPNLHLQSNVNSQAIQNAAYNARQNGGSSGSSYSYDPFTNTAARVDVSITPASRLGMSGSSYGSVGTSSRAATDPFFQGVQYGHSGGIGGGGAVSTQFNLVTGQVYTNEGVCLTSPDISINNIQVWRGAPTKGNAFTLNPSLSLAFGFSLNGQLSLNANKLAQGKVDFSTDWGIGYTELGRGSIPFRPSVSLFFESTTPFGGTVYDSSWDRLVNDFNRTSLKPWEWDFGQGYQ